MSKKIIIIAAAVILILALTAFFFFLHNKQVKQAGITAELNTLKLAQEYMNKGEFDRAMQLLDGLLIKNPDNQRSEEHTSELQSH